MKCSTYSVVALEARGLLRDISYRTRYRLNRSSNCFELTKPHDLRNCIILFPYALFGFRNRASGFLIDVVKSALLEKSSYYYGLDRLGLHFPEFVKLRSAAARFRRNRLVLRQLSWFLGIVASGLNRYLTEPIALRVGSCPILSTQY